MSKGQFIKFLLLANFGLLILVVIIAAGGWLYLSNYHSSTETPGSTRNSNQSDADALVLGLSAFDKPIMLYRLENDRAKVLLYQSPIHYQEIFQLTLAHSYLPVTSQLLNFDNQSILYTVSDFNTETVRRYALDGTAHDVFQSNQTINSIFTLNAKLYILSKQDDQYEIYRADLFGKEEKLVSFTSTDELYFHQLNYSKVELRINNTADCYTLDWFSSTPTLGSTTACSEASNLTDYFTNHYQIFSRVVSVFNTPDSYPASFPANSPDSYPDNNPNSMIRLVTRQYLYSNAIVQKVHNLNPNASDDELNQFLLPEEYLIESINNAQWQVIYSSDQITLILEATLDSSERNLITLYPDSSFVRMRLPVISDLVYLGSHTEYAESSPSQFFFVSQAKVSGIERDSIISFDLKSRSLVEYQLPECSPSSNNCNAGIINHYD